ncbi:MAG TPA: hypothetical protein DCE41_36305 [Cytophagales bacterium]|nr:hypothetical protein [Cytophagales bacterium]
MHYVGKTDVNEVSQLINNGLTLSTENVRIAPADGVVQPLSETTIYLLHDPKAVQSQVYYSVTGKPFDVEDLSAARAFNSYYGGGFSGLVLQEIREYRSLAYSVGGSLNYTGYSDEEPTQLVSFTGSQADKTTDAVTVMLDMINELPEKPDRMPSQLSYLKQSALTSRPGFRGLSQSVEGWEVVGYTQDPNSLAFAGYDALEFSDIVALHEKYVKGQPILVTIYGDKDKMDLDKLGQLGTIVEVEADAVMVK